MLINPGIGVTIENVSTSSVTIAEKQPLTQTLLNIIPKNPVESLATADMLPIIVFALFVGILLAKMGNKASTVANLFQSVQRPYDGNDYGSYEGSSYRCILPYRKNIC